MNLRTSALVALLASLAPSASSAAECGKWYSSTCVCDADHRYCPDGTNGASDDIKDQHPFWADYEGYYKFTSHPFLFGLYPVVNPTGWFGWFKLYPSQGFMNQTIEGSRTYNHRYTVNLPNPDANCTVEGVEDWKGECGVNGLAFVQEGWGTGTPERDGTVVTTLALQPSSGGAGPGIENSPQITDENAEYKQVPIDENTLFGSAKSQNFLVTETFSFTNEEKTQASAVQDVYLTVNETTTLVQSIRMTFEKFESAEEFKEALYDEYNAANILEADRFEVPMIEPCHTIFDQECPTEEDFCEIDPRCMATVKYQEPDASVEAGPIVGIVVACFVVLLAVLYYLHRKAMREQAERNQAVFARRIAETIKLEGPDRELTPEALAEEFKKIDNGNVDGSIDKDELWNFINSGKVAKMSKSDFNALFAALDTDGDGTVSFMEFSAYMGKCYDDFDKMKGSDSVRAARGGRMDQYYAGVSKRILEIEPAEPIEPMDKIKEEEKDEETQ